MARKKEVETELDVEKAIIKKFGDIIVSSEYILDNKPLVIPTTPRLDIILGGGVQEGNFVVINGPMGLGKSAMALHLAGNAQKIPSKYGDRTVYYFDIEGRIKERDLYKNHNLDLNPERFKLIKSVEGKILTGEDFMDIGETILKNVPGSVLIFDSFSAICTSERHSANIGDRFRDNAPALLSMFVKRINQIIPVNKNIVIGITHRIANTSGMGRSTTTEAGGNKIQYQADVKVRGNYAESWDYQDTPIGQKVHWTCEKSALSGPNGKTSCYLRYNHGYDIEAELLELACDCSLVQKAGAWLSYEKDGELIKKQGFENFLSYLKDTPELCQELSVQLREKMGLDAL